MTTNNPLLDWETIPAYDQIQPTHIVPAITSLLAESEQQLHRLEQAEAETWAELMPAVERLEDRVSRVWNLVDHLQAVQNSPELREAYQATQGEVVAFFTRYGQSQPLYHTLRQLRDGADWPTYSLAQQRIITSHLREAELNGVALPEAERQRFTAISQRLAELEMQFNNHVLDATKAFRLTLSSSDEVAGLPTMLLAMAAETARRDGLGQESGEEATAVSGPWAFTLDYPVYAPFMQHSRRRELREKMFRAYNSIASDLGGAPELDNSLLIAEILALRHEQAQLLGFPNFAAMSLSRKMAEGDTAVFDLLHDLRIKSRPAGERDAAELRELARTHHAPEADDFQPWDTLFWMERLREEAYQLNDEQLRPYFALPIVLQGMFSLVEMLFGIRVTPANKPIPVWHPDVTYYDVYDVDSGDLIAGFFLDPYSRPAEKRGGAWMNILVGRSKVVLPVGADTRLPIAYMCCNQTPPVEGKPSLMSFSEVETLFHEFGHALQHMLTTVDEGLAAGLSNVEWDAIEIASQFMENWCYHRPTLLSMARHYETGEPLPDELVNRILKVRTFQAGYAMLRQLHFGLFDMTLHSNYDPANPPDPAVVHQTLATQTWVIPPIADDRFWCGFSHLFGGGYAAGYYSYKWSEVLSADAFAAFEEVGVNDVQGGNDTAVAQLGRHFRNTILAMGGSAHPLDVYRTFRGRAATTSALLRHSGLTD
jgi:oligopeptidase A